MQISVFILVTLSPFILSAGGQESKKRRDISITHHGNFHWTIHEIDGDYYKERKLSPKRQVGHLFEGDRVIGRLYIGSLREKVPLTKDDLRAVPPCLSLSVWELEVGGNGRYVKKVQNPVAQFSLKDLELDKDHHLYKKWSEFFSYESHNEGLFTEYYNLNEMGVSLKEGVYLLDIFTNDPKCSLNILYNSSGVHIQIHKPNTKRMKAMKLCWEGMKNLRGKRWSKISAWDEAVEKYFKPSLKIDPNLHCTLKHLGFYYKRKGDVKRYEEYLRRIHKTVKSRHLKDVTERAMKREGFKIKE